MSASTVSTPVSWNGRLLNATLAGELASSDLHGRIPTNPIFGLAADEVPRGRVLVVADEAIVSLDLQRVLRDAGYRVVGPVSAMHEIERLLRRGGIDCAIVDLEIDKKTPLPVADLLSYYDVPFVFVGGEKDRAQAPHRNRPVIRKPIDREALVAALAKVTSRSQAGLAGADRLPWPRVFPQL